MHSTPTRYTLKDVVGFCILNKGRRGFKDCTYWQLIGIIDEAARQDRLYIVDDDKGICGVCIITIDGNKLYINRIVCVRSGFKTLILEAQKRFPNMEIQGKRDGKLKTFKRKYLWQILGLHQ